MKIIFYGGTKQVTGANYLLDSGTTRILVDCGLNQGSKFAEDMNYADFEYAPKDIDAICITHSHVDHIGRLPKLYKDGFRGIVLGTKPTIELTKLVMSDSLDIIGEEARKDNHPPLYTKEDVIGVNELVRGLNYHEKINIGDMDIMLHDAGHILGSSIIEIKWLKDGEAKHIYFSGDLGNPPTPLLRSTEYIRNADYVVIESAYGNRVHEDVELRREELENTVENTVKNGGTLIIPTFAMERTQELLYELNGLLENKRIPQVPVFIDSPLAIKITAVYKKYHDYFNKEVDYLIKSGDDIFKFPGLKLTSSVQESKAINDISSPKIIIAGSGMSQGGRILHHEIRYLPDSRSTILFIGYQVSGSLGRKILDGQKKVKILGQDINVMCNIKAIGGYSAHADQPALIKWVKASRSYLKGTESCNFIKDANNLNQETNEEDNTGKHKLKKVFIVQGEKESSDALAVAIRDNLAIDAIVPNEGDEFEL